MVRQWHQVVAVAVDILAAGSLVVGDNRAVAAILADNLGVVDNPEEAAGNLGIPADRAGEDSSAEFADSPVGNIDFGRREAGLRAAEGAGSPAEEDSG